MLEGPQKHHAPTKASQNGGSVGSKRRPLYGGRLRSSSESSSSSNDPSNRGNVDTVLFKNLVEMVPLVESLMERKAKPSFTRRASMVYTPAPSQVKKVLDPNRSLRRSYSSVKKRKDTGDTVSLKSASGDSSISTKVPVGNIQKDREELTILQGQMDDLQKKLAEKDEALKSAEDSLNQMNAAYRSLDELKHQVTVKDSLMHSTNAQLYDAKIKLADNQATLEKLEWEVQTSNRKVEELQGNVVSMELGVNALMHIFEELTKTDSAAYPDVDIDSCYHFEQLPHVDEIADEIETEKMEEARTAYEAAVAAAKRNPSEDLIAAAAEARQRLRAFVL